MGTLPLNASVTRCMGCGNLLDSSALICPNCRRLVHAQAIHQLARQAADFSKSGKIAAARECWIQALQLLPPGSDEYESISATIRHMNSELGLVQGPVQRKAATGAPAWAKRFGPLGAAVAFLLKFKTVALLLLTKGKLLLLGLGNLKMLLGMSAYIGLYWALYGWKFAVGAIGSIFIHEMGHYFTVRQHGFAADAPVFLPGFGAYVRWRGGNVDPVIRAHIALAGPLFGFLAALVFSGMFVTLHDGAWLAVAQFGAWLNLLNLIPVFIFDGASACIALSRQERLGILVISGVLWYLLGNMMFLFIALGAGYRVFLKKDFPVQSSRGTAYYFVALLIAFGMLYWWSTAQIQGLHGITDGSGY